MKLTISNLLEIPDISSLRVLVARKWPGLHAREEVDQWDPDLAASAELSDLLTSERISESEFVAQYRKELENNYSLVPWLAAIANNSGLTLVFDPSDPTTEVCVKILAEQVSVGSS